MKLITSHTTIHILAFQRSYQYLLRLAVILVMQLRLDVHGLILNKLEALVVTEHLPQHS
jgi:hypothetical protein